MLVFIDESGDPGFKFEQGSSSHFVIALIIFKSDEDAERTTTAIKALRQKFGFHPSHEFKFHKLKDSYRLAFLEGVKSLPYSVRAMVVDKRIIENDYLRNTKEAFYGYFVSEVIKHYQGNLKDANIKLDGSGDKVFKRAFQTYLRRKVKEGTIKKFRFNDSKTNNLIQLADIIAGAINRKYHVRKPNNSFYQLIEHKIEDCWLFDQKNWPAS